MTDGIMDLPDALLRRDDPADAGLERPVEPTGTRTVPVGLAS
jgi:hypothetical protein